MTTFRIWLPVRAVVPLFAGTLDNMPNDTVLIEIGLDYPEGEDFSPSYPYPYWYYTYQGYSFGHNFYNSYNSHSAFTLHDTNSLPIRAEDYGYPRPGNISKSYHRVFEHWPVKGHYISTKLRYHDDFRLPTRFSCRDIILITGNPFQIIEPQPQLYTLYTPFFFMDNPNVFYVTVSWSWVTIPDYYYYGVLAGWRARLRP